MANLPAKRTESTELSARERLNESILDQLERGMTVPDIARRLAPDDKRKQKSWRSKIRRLVYHDVDFQRSLAARVKGQMMLDLVGGGVALGQRAKRGRPDAMKMLMEATGFHNPRVKHEHSGEISVKVSTPRPKFEHIEDADVVEE